MKKATSAGGVIVKIIDGKHHVLLIRDLDYADWFLPKGHVEGQETLEEAALREVEEEVGLRYVKILKLLGTALRYVEKADEDKTIHYFLFKTTVIDEEPRAEDPEKFELKWFPLNCLPKFYFKEQEDAIKKNIELIRKTIK